MGIPVIIMAMLEPSLHKTAPKTGNFRGVLVYNGLGIVWFVWLISFWIGAQILVVLGVSLPSWIRYLEYLFPVLAGSCAFGLFDDWASNNQIKGFRGHLNALVHGRLTTGGLKFLGIGFLSLFLAISLYYDGPETILHVVLVTCVIALTANLMNLFDLRPGRAGKMYILGLVIAIVFFIVFRFADALGWWSLLGLTLAALGPLVAVWRFDLAERGMIGDAGANSMGALLGFFYATSLPIWALVILTVFLATINLLSERFSFTKIIEGSKVLTALDELGRRKDIAADDGEGSSVQDGAQRATQRATQSVTQDATQHATQRAMQDGDMNENRTSGK